MKGIRSKLIDGIIVASLFAATVAHGQDKPPLRIGVIAEFQAIAGASIPGSAQIAADEINASGGVDGRKVELVIYDDHSASTEAVRAFQRAVSQDKVNVVIGSYAREVGYRQTVSNRTLDGLFPGTAHQPWALSGRD